MSDPYSMARGGKLKFRKGKDKPRRPKRSRPAESERARGRADTEECTRRHGGWAVLDCFAVVHGSVAMEMGDMKYVRALDDGLLRLGAERAPGEGPEPEEVFTALRVSDSHVALKSGYGKYLGVRSDGRVVAVQDAVGTREQWQPVFQDGRTALQGCNERFLTVAGPEGTLFCSSETASEEQFVRFRSCGSSKREDEKKERDEDTGKLLDVEMNYVKKYQSFGNKRVILDTEDRKAVKKARKEGSLHEMLLDRRMKLKSDKFC